MTPPRKAKRKPPSPAPKAAPKTLRMSVDDAVKAMSWLQPSDLAAVDLARMYADRIDAALATELGPDVTKALYLGPHLLNTLRALGGAPVERKALGAEEAVGGKLAQLRSVAAGPKAG